MKLQDLINIKGIFPVLLLSLFSKSYSQETVFVDYDAAGNRIQVYKLAPRAVQSPTLFDIYNYSSRSNGNNAIANVLLNVDQSTLAMLQTGTINIDSTIALLPNDFGHIDFSSKDKPDEKFIVSPNPSRDIITLLEQKESENLPYNIILYDAFGKMVEQFWKVQAPFVIDLQKYGIGFYYLRVYNEKVQKTIKIVKI